MKIYPFPAEDKNNPFLRELYRHIEGVTPTSLWNIRTPGIIHIHWSIILYGSKWALKSLVLIKVNFLRLLFLKTFRGCKIIWTMHNYYAHDYPHHWIDRLGRRLLFALADVIIIQQKTAQEVFAKNIPAKTLYIFPWEIISAYTDPPSPQHTKR